MCICIAWICIKLEEQDSLNKEKQTEHVLCQQVWTFGPNNPQMTSIFSQQKNNNKLKLMSHDI